MNKGGITIMKKTEYDVIEKYMISCMGDSALKRQNSAKAFYESMLKETREAY